ncbi:MAG: FtsX-like permease family protein [Clostridia bacterium]|nr:FtsX-like permease family protein [Clostridia bacterium]
MLRFVIRKMVSKKWMVLALLIGNILLVSITASNPMYTQAVLQRTLITSMSNYMSEKNRYPGLFVLRAGGLPSKNGLVLEARDVVGGMPETFGLPAREQVAHYSLNASNTESSLEREDRKRTQISLGTLSGINDHIELVAGTGQSSEPDEDGVVDVILSERGIVDTELILGEVLTFPSILRPDGEPVRVRIAGVFRNSNPTDPYWVLSPSNYSAELFLDQALFEQWFMTGEMPYGVTAVWYTLLEYTAFRVDQVDSIQAAAEGYNEYVGAYSGMSTSNNFTTLLKDFQKTERKVRVTMWVLQAPIFVLLAAFIFMVSRQMLDMEQAEIAVLKSRGAGRAQIITVYLMQSVIVALIALAIGLPLAALLVQVLGSANAFLEFVRRSALQVELNRQALLFAGLASLFSIGAMVLPVRRYSRVSIVNQKQQKHRRSDAPLWQRLFLDVLALGVSLYGLYSFNNQRAYLAQSVMEGASVDPLLYLSSSLFMLGAGLFAVRVLPAVVWLVFSLFKKHWSPALYASFLRVLRTRHQQGFIMVFLVMTIALGVFDASAARTINTNDETNLRYMAGADIVLQEYWEDNSALRAEDPNIELEYREPDYGRFTSLEGAASVTRVLVNNTGTMSVPGGTLKNICVMGINTKEFGQTAWFDETLLPEHWYNYLNAMAQKARAVLLSSNFKQDYGYAIGDAIYFKTSSGSPVRGVIYGFVDYWPSYASTVYTKGSNGLYSEEKKYLIVANLSQLQAVWGVTPYQIWMRAKDSSQFIYDFAEQSGASFSRFDVTAADIVALKNDPVIQGTNGILTVGFIVVLVLCAVGFLIYWVLSIQSRALQFGIFRAMGMSMREIVTMLVNEHIFISGAAIATGALVGYLTARLYMPLIQIAYSSSDNALPLRVVSQQSDNVRLAIIVAAMIGLCLVILGVLINRMKIAQALKLGED